MRLYRIYDFEIFIIPIKLIAVEHIEVKTKSGDPPFCQDMHYGIG